jgi:KDO2-lipid IV(A) lauroyltransferase
VVIALLGYPFGAVFLTHKHKKVNDFFVSQRISKGVKVIPLGKAAMHCLNALRKGEIIALVGDRDFTGKGVVLDFFGKPTIFPRGPAEFYLRTGAPIIPGFMVRNPDDTFTLRMEKPIEFTPTDDKERDVKEITALYRNVIEDYVRKYPDQWYMYVRFWVGAEK